MRAISATGNARLHARDTNHEGGFTLMELLVVIAILVLLGSAFPVALDRALPGRRVVVTTQKLVSAIRDAQSLSTARGRPVRLELSGSCLIGDRVLVQIPATTHVEMKDAEGLKLQAVSAFPEGTLTEARIVISERSHLRMVHLSGLTGRVTIEAPTHAR